MLGYFGYLRLVFKNGILQICKKTKTMDANKTLADYEKFGELILEKNVYMNPSATFPMLCALIGADRKALNSLIREELGMSGEMLLGALRARAWK